MISKNVCVYTQWPDLIYSSSGQWQITVRDNLRNLIESTVAEYNYKNVCRFVARTHDRNISPEFESFVFVLEPCQINLDDIVYCIPDSCSTVFDSAGRYIFYRRRPQWNHIEKVMEDFHRPVGVIFIDCWQNIEDSPWTNVPDGFDFYQEMINILQTYKVNCRIFHTNSFGGHALANKLQAWHALPKSKNIDSLDQFELSGLDHWIVVGAHWQRCTHDRPLGFNALLQMKKSNSQLKIYSLGLATAKFVNDNIDQPIVSICTEQDYLVDQLTWKVQGKLVELQI